MKKILPTLAVLAALLPTTAAAWSPQTRVRMADEAVRLLPKSLRMALERYREPLLRGLLEPQTGEDGAQHRPPWLEGSLDAEVERRAAELVRSVREAAPFAEIAAGFGALAHFVMDAGFPPGMSDSGDRYAHFRGFCESRRERFPLVFYGHEPEMIEQPDYRAFALKVMQRSRLEDGELARAYLAAGDPPAAWAFDDRSVPFAVGSLSYSRSVTDVVRVWMAAWSESNGDLGRTPYLKRKKKRKQEAKDGG